MDEIIQRFNENSVRYLVIGGQAARLTGVPRFSMDWDVFIPPHDKQNIDLINSVLHDELDMELEPLGPGGANFIQTYQTRFGILQFHLGGPGLPDFNKAEANASIAKTENGICVKKLSDEDLLKSKEAAGRPEDQTDIEFLRLKLKRKNLGS
ncbi:MAG: hypothetical protein PHP44_07560 [Kiritimatiellae bacterium]|nr:hypothetical protein [Kiritimatiellia bacterium]MDD4735946.1 hypothetical protein [Kiritimatiellia bacterium]